MNDQASKYFGVARPDRSKVVFPDDVIFLCGGQLGTTLRTVKSLRDYIWREREAICPENSFVLAEKASQKFDVKVFDNLIELEAYIASVSRVVLLICESAGSIAELGAFSQVPEISAKLQVFVKGQHYSDNSFIRDGPLRQLEDQNEVSVQQFEWLEKGRGSIDVDSAKKITPSMTFAIGQFQKNQNQTEAFNDKKIGHRMLLIAGILHMARCCKLREVTGYCQNFGVEMQEGEIKKHLFCLEILGWIEVVKRDTKYYYYKLPAAPFGFGGTYPILDPIRVRHDVMNSYDNADPRVNVVRELELG